MPSATPSPYANWEYFLVPRGSVGRGPSDWEANFQAQYPIRLGDNRRLNLIFDVFNLFDRQNTIQLDERYNLLQSTDGAPASRPASCNGDNQWLTEPGTLLPVGLVVRSARDGDRTRITWRKVCSFTQPRSIRLGVRFQW